MIEERTEPEGTEDPGDLGEPVTELRELEVAITAGFLSRVLNGLRRRSLANHLSAMIWAGGAQAFLEFLKMAFSMLDSGKPPKGGSDR